MRPTLILHIGLERTGTTALQRFCVRHNRRLREASIIYPTRSLAFARGNHAPLAGCYFSGDIQDFTVPSPPARKTRILTSLFREIDSSGSDIALLSSEHFSSRLRLPQIRELAADLADYECRIGVVVRDHISRFFSAYATHIVSGGTMAVETYADCMLAPGVLDFRYADAIGQWEEAFGKENVGVFLYNRKGDALREMVERFAPRGVRAPSSPSYRENVSYGPLVTEAFRRANARATQRCSWSNAPRKWERRRIVRILMQLWLKTTTIDPRAGRWTLDDGRMAQLKTLAATDRQFLGERYHLRMPEAATTATAAESADLRLEKFVQRADLVWRLAGAAEPLFAAAPFVAGAARWARDAVRL